MTNKAPLSEYEDKILRALYYDQQLPIGAAPNQAIEFLKESGYVEIGPAIGRAPGRIHLTHKAFAYLRDHAEPLENEGPPLSAGIIECHPSGPPWPSLIPSVYPVEDCFSHAEYDKLLEETVAKIRELSSKKGGEYAGDEDRLANFRRHGKALGLPMETVWAVYAGKHWDAIQQYIRDKRDGKKRDRLEPIEGRVDDLIVYCILLKAMLIEEKRG